MTSALNKSPSAIRTTSGKSTLNLDLKAGLKGLKNLFSKGPVNKTADNNKIAKSSQQAEIGKSQAFSNRSGPGVNQSTTNTQSKEAPSNNSRANDTLASNNVESAQNGKELGADLKVPGCSGGCGCGCTG